MAIKTEMLLEHCQVITKKIHLMISLIEQLFVIGRNVDSSNCAIGAYLVESTLNRCEVVAGGRDWPEGTSSLLVLRIFILEEQPHVLKIELYMRKKHTKIKIFRISLFDLITSDKLIGKIKVLNFLAIYLNF